MHDTPNVLYYIKTNGGGKVKIVGEQMMAQQYGMAFPKGCALVAKVNASLAKLKANGTYDAIYEKGSARSPRSPDPAPAHARAGPVAGAAPFERDASMEFDWSVIWAALRSCSAGHGSRSSSRLPASPAASCSA